METKMKMKITRAQEMKAKGMSWPEIRKALVAEGYSLGETWAFSLGPADFWPEGVTRGRMVCQGYSDFESWTGGASDYLWAWIDQGRWYLGVGPAYCVREICPRVEVSPGDTVDLKAAFRAKAGIVRVVGAGW